MNIVQQLQNFYKGKKVFITGHTGFKGAWLAIWLKKMGAEVSAYSLEPENESLFNILQIDKEINSVFGDIRDFDNLHQTIAKAQPQIVIHMAAQAFVLESYRNPKITYETNVIGVVNLFESIRKIPSIKAVVNITTDKCYENKELDLPFKEEDRLGGHDPYSSSKACAEIVTSCWRDSFFNKEGRVMLASARAGNVIGGGDFSLDRIIPDIFKSIVKNEAVFLRSPKATRPWQHVLEPLFGYLLLAMKLFEDGKKYTSSYNFGPDKESSINVEEIAKTFIEKIKKGKYIINENSDFHEAKTLRLDNSKAKKELGWRPIFDFDKTIEYTANWYENYIKNKSEIKNFTSKQIDNFLKLHS